MHKFLAATLLYTIGLCAEEPPSIPLPRTMNATLRTTQPGGIGYSQGYTTLQSFFSFKDSKDISLLDLRGHVFNNGRLAANAGAGFRILSHCRAYGMNVFYDYRDTTHHPFSQLGVGFETLGENWDIGINGYFPMGSKESGIYHEHGSPKVEVSLKGGDALLGFPLMKMQDIILNGAIGPYYYRGHEGISVVGGKAQVRLQFKQYFSLAAYGSYDSYFHARVQGEIAFSYPFGPRVSKGKKESCGSRLFQNITQKVNRAEIIALASHSK